MSYEACLQELEWLKSMDASLKLLVTPESKTYYSIVDEWSVVQVGNAYEYQKQVTLTGAAQNIDLTIPFAIQLNRVEFFSDDETAKSFSLRVFSGSVPPTSYAELVTLTADTNIPILVQIGDVYKYLQSPIKIRVAVSASTAGKILTIKVACDKL